MFKLTSTVTGNVIAALKSLFSRYGLPEILRSDNGPQYNSDEFATYMKEHGIRHVTSNPYYPQSNGQAERTVQTVKRLFK